MGEKQTAATGGDEATFGPWMLPKYGTRRYNGRGNRRGNGGRSSGNTMHEWRAGDTTIELGQEQQQPKSTTVEDGVAHAMDLHTGLTRQREKAKGKKVLQQDSQSRFAILDQLGQAEDLAHDLDSLKQKIQVVPGPSNKAGAGPAHEKPKGTQKKDKGPMHPNTTKDNGGNNYQQAGKDVAPRRVL